jgi:PEP-CTERM motif
LFLDEYTPGGSLVQTIALPTAVSGSNLRLTIQGTATSEGFLQLSADQQYLTLVGYDANAGTAAPSGQSAATINRVVGRVTLASGSVDTTTAINSGTLGATRSATTANGTGFWVSTASAGVNYVAYGAPSAATQLSTAPSNTRVTRDIGGQLYVSSASTTFQGVSTIGTGLPTALGQTTTLLNGFPTASGPSSYDFFVSGNSAWVADDRTTQGLQKWTFDGTTWSLQYTIGRTGVGDRGLTVDPSTLSTTPTFYVTTTDNKVDEIVDGGTLGSFTDTTIFSDLTSNTAFRGIAFAPTAVPEPSTTALVGLGLMAWTSIRRRK